MLDKTSHTLYKLGIATWISTTMQHSKYYKEVEVLLNTCWEWLQNHQPSADYIYSMLDDGSEFGGLIIYMQGDASEYESKWNCIFEAGASVASLAYEYEGQKYLPPLLEEVSSEEQDMFFEKQLENVIGNKIKLLDDYKEYVANIDNLDREQVLNKLSRVLNFD